MKNLIFDHYDREYVTLLCVKLQFSVSQGRWRKTGGAIAESDCSNAMINKRGNRFRCTVSSYLLLPPFCASHS